MRRLQRFDAEINSAARGNPTQSTSQVPSPLDSLILEDALRALLASASSQPNQPLYRPGHPNVYAEPNFPASARSSSPVTGIDWNLLEAYEDPVPDQEKSPQDQLRENLCQATLDFLNYDRVSDFGDPSDSGSVHSKSNLQQHFTKYLTALKMTTRATQSPFVRVIYHANALVRTN